MRNYAMKLQTSSLNTAAAARRTIHFCARNMRLQPIEPRKIGANLACDQQLIIADSNFPLGYRKLI